MSRGRTKGPTAKAKPAREHRKALIVGPNPVEDAVIGALRVGAALESHMGKFFHGYGITVRQYNILRILYVRDPEGQGLPTAEISSRMLGRFPDLPRLIDRLVKAGFLERVRSTEDRRVVRLRLTPEGFALVERIHGPLLANNRALVAHMSTPELERLAEGLRRALEGRLSLTGAFEEPGAGPGD